jgi:hypothetical protein
MFLIIGAGGETVATAVQKTYIILLPLFMVLELCNYVNGTT